MVYMQFSLVVAQTPIQQADISLTAVVSDTTEVMPGELATLVVRAENQSSAKRTVDIHVDAPVGWTAAATTATVSLDGGESMLLFVSVRPASTVPPGTYRIRVTGSSREYRDAQSVVEAIYSVGLVRAMVLVIKPTNEFILAGRAIEVRATLTNNSNRIETGSLVVEGGPSFDVSVKKKEWSLLPAETAEFVLVITTDGSTTAQYEGRLRLKSIFGAEEYDKVAASRGFTVVPTNRNRTRNVPDIPVVLSLQAVGDNDGTNPQYGLRGSTNALDGQVLFDVLYSGGPRTSLYGARDHAFLSYTNQYGYVIFGDHSQRLTPLTSSGLYGVGIGGSGQTRRLFASGTIAKTRFMSPEQTVAGAVVGYHVTRHIILSANTVSRTGLFDGSFFSARSQIQFLDRNNQADIECGIDDESRFDTMSCMVGLTGQAAGVTYRARASDISSTFPGSRAGLRERSGSLGYSLGSGVSVSGSAMTISQDYAEGFSNEQSFYEAGLSLSLPVGAKSIRADVFYIFRNREYVSVMSTSDRLENAVRTSLMYKNFLGSIRGTVELGTASSKNIGYDGSTWKSRLSASIRLSRKITLTASGNYDTGFLVNTASELSRASLSALITVRPASYSDFSAGVVHTRNDGIFSSDYRSYRFRYRHRLPFGHEIELAAQVVDFGSAKSEIATNFLISYSVPVGLSGPRRKSTAESIRGRVYDAETGEGMADVIVFIGDNVSITDSNGWFSFPIAGITSNYITIDQRSIGIENTALIDIPIRLRDIIDLTIPIDIPIVRSAQVSGTVSIWEREGGSNLLGQQNAPLIQGSQLRGVLLELRSGSKVFSVRTDRSGRFYFRQIPSGSYELNILSGDLPEGHEFESGSLMVSVSPGQESEYHFRVLPIRRTIKMIGSNDLELIERGGTKKRREQRKLEQRELEQREREK